VPYRLNTLGFLATADLAAEEGWVANQGIADAIAALQWVQREIAAFGGDKSRVTLMGQSSGGTLILALFCAPSAAGLFTGAISLSGSPNITQGAAAKWQQDEPVLAALNCSGQASAAERVACLRAVPATALAQATPKPSWDTPGIFGWALPQGIPAPPAGAQYAGIVHIDGVLLTQPFHTALTAELVPAALIISNMEAEGDGGSGIGVRNESLAQWATALHASFASWPGSSGSSAAAALYEAYLPEATVDPDLAYASINSDYGLSCAARALAAMVAATGSQRQHPLYVLYNAWQRGSWSPDGNGRWPYHALDLQELGWSWSTGVVPTASDLLAAALLQQLVADFAFGSGTMPAAWGWEPVTPGQPLQTLVFAQQSGFPGGGARAEAHWKEAQCAVLEAQGMKQGWWWCD
jgi:carboxylesterase type B